MGQLDEEQLYYTISRGLDRKQATKMILTGFLQPIIKEIPQEKLREKITAIIEEKIYGK